MYGDARGGRCLHGRERAQPVFMPRRYADRTARYNKSVHRTNIHMTSTQRHQARYERRKQRRAQRRQEAIAQYDSFDRLCTMNALFKAALLSRKSIRWKSSVQRYFMCYLRNLLDLRGKLLAGENVTVGFIEFDILERGKKRHIKSVHFKERVAQRVLCDNALVPVLSRSLIYDNGASLKDRGISFARNRLVQHLHQYYRRTGSNEGYILLMDFSGYFDNILHEPLYGMLDRAFTDRRIIELTRSFVEPFGEKSLGIGSQVSQILAVSYRNSIDHYVKEELRMKEYGCYMDDSYIISRDKKTLRRCLHEIETRCSAKGIKLNAKKTQIVKLSCGFVFMKGRFFLTGTGRVIIKPSKGNTVRQRRKLKKFRQYYDTGQMSLEQLLCSYSSYRGYILKDYNSHRTVRSMDKLFHELFGYDVQITKTEVF